MNVLIVGSGGREHALAWKAAESRRLSKLYIAPGNAGTAQVGENVPIPAEDAAGLVDFVTGQRIDLVIIGPETPLALGLADVLRAAGGRVFGPSQAAAQIEASKAFAKAFMERRAIPSARYAAFNNFSSASAFLTQLGYPVVIKASGLAAGKGVVLPASPQEAEAALHAIMVGGEFGDAGSQVVIEERLAGQEVSLLAFSDGYTVRPMPPAQDHKRLLDGDLGPNTGGMGAYAPASLCPPEMVSQIVTDILQPAVDGLRSEDRPFVGVLYAGLMLTANGPSVLEFNCRFGDPETQAILPLLETDLLDVIEACVEGRLRDLDIHWKSGAAACVVLASEDYPGKAPTGRAITGLDAPTENAVVFHAGTVREIERVLTAGGRVLGVTGWGPDLPGALKAAYAAISGIHFEGMQYRKDIGAKAGEGALASAYAATGVDIGAGNRAVTLMRRAVQATYNSRVLAGIGAFGGAFDASAVKRMDEPVLVASTDGVGTKVLLAVQAGRYASIGQDLVNHCVNDILVQGASPLFFLDYVASGKLEPEVAAEIVDGISIACRHAGCALLGGETAEMPGVYVEGKLDVVGAIVGVVERASLLPCAPVRAGDLLVGLASSGAHTNGYSLLRKIFAGVPLDSTFPGLGVSLGEALLAVHRSYLPALLPILNCQPPVVKALAHITGGGFLDNLPRILPADLDAVVFLDRWDVPPLFTLAQERGSISTAEMYRVFNMGIGMVAVVEPAQIDVFCDMAPEEVFVIGEIVPGKRSVLLQ